MSQKQTHFRPLTSVIVIAAIVWLGGAIVTHAQQDGGLTPKQQGGTAGVGSPSAKTALAPEPGIVVVRKHSPGPQSVMVSGAAPWVEFSVTATSHEFHVRQPGCYAAKWGRLKVRSNSSVVIDFEGFGDLVTRSTLRPVPWELGTAPPLSPVGQVNFMPAETFNTQDIRLAPDEARNFECDLWSRITVSTASVAGDYIRKAGIVLVLETARDWEEVNDLIGTEQD